MEDYLENSLVDLLWLKILYDWRFSFRLQSSKETPNISSDLLFYPHFYLSVAYFNLMQKPELVVLW